MRIQCNFSAVEAAIELANEIAAFPQACMIKDKESAMYATYDSKSWQDAFDYEFQNGLFVLDEAKKGKSRKRTILVNEITATEPCSAQMQPKTQSLAQFWFNIFRCGSFCIRCGTSWLFWIIQVKTSEQNLKLTNEKYERRRNKDTNWEKVAWAENWNLCENWELNVDRKNMNIVLFVNFEKA